MKSMDQHCFKRVMMAALLCVILSGCAGESAPKTQASATAQADKTGTGEKVKPLETIAPLPTPMDTFRALAQPSGLAPKPLFAGPAPDTEARMKRLEDSVQTLRNDFDTVVPTLVRMVSMEKDIKELVGQLKKLSGEEQALPEGQMEQGDPVPEETINPGLASQAAAPDKNQMGPPAPPAKEMAQERPGAPAAASETKLASQTTDALPVKTIGTVENVRFGDHNGMTRIVFDMTAKPAYTTGLQENGTRLVVEVSDMSWTAPLAKTLTGKLRVSGYSYENGKAVFSLTGPSRILTQQILPGDDNKGAKLVIDLGKAAP